MAVQSLTSVSLREDLVPALQPASVDMEAGILHRVKIVGLVSRNGRRYTREALREAEPLYEGAMANIDHPARVHDDRSARDRFGKYRNVSFQDGTDDTAGMYGDVLLNVAHDMAPSVLYAANNPELRDLYGFSHNADGEGEWENGAFVVKRITRVRSIDLVADPATTKGLFESHRTMKIKLRAFLETALSKLTTKSQPELKKLLEACQYDKAMEGEMDVPADPGGAGGQMDGRSLLAQAVGILAQSTDPADHDLAHKIMKIIKPEAATPTESEDEEKKPMESFRDKGNAGMALLERRLMAHDLCADAGIVPNKLLRKAMGACETKEEMTAILEEFKADKAIVRLRPDSTPNKPAPAPANRTSNGPTTYDEFIASLKN